MSRAERRNKHAYTQKNQPGLQSQPNSTMLNRALSIRSSNRSSTGTSTSSTPGSANPPSTTSHHRFSLTSLRSPRHATPSTRLHRLIKSTNLLIHAHTTAGKERLSIATQLSEWGSGMDPALSDVSDKVGVVLSELGEQEDAYARALDDARAPLKTIRDTERSVAPVRAGRERVAEEIARVKMKEGPGSTRLVVLEQELVRAEAEGLVGEAQVGNVTRQKLKEAYTAEFLATIERAEKQVILARHGLRLLQVLDDTPVVPGDVRPPYEGAAQTRQILNDAEDDLRDWQLPEGLLGEGEGVGGAMTPTPGRGNGKSPDRGDVEV
ncbi:putative sphingolipid long chain base-responsive protein [Podospora conica]|nr:putative sphingolipid long chain base-responsive protein [Schizothecium conicum]